MRRYRRAARRHVGLFKPTCVASFGFARQLLLQLGVVVVGALVVFAADLREDPNAAEKRFVIPVLRTSQGSICDFYKGDFGPEVFNRLGKIFHLVDVQWPLLAYKALCAFGATPTGTWHPRRRRDAASRTTCWVSFACSCSWSQYQLYWKSPYGRAIRAARRRPRTARSSIVWLVFPGPLRLARTVALLLVAVAAPGPGATRGGTWKSDVLFAAGCGGCFSRGPRDPALLAQS